MELRIHGPVLVTHPPVPAAGALAGALEGALEGVLEGAVGVVAMTCMDMWICVGMDERMGEG